MSSPPTPAAPDAVVVGGSLSGLATALALAEKGCSVRVLERAEPPPDGPVHKAAEVWERPTVPQSAHSHVLVSLGVRVLRERAPWLLDAALEEGGRLLDHLDALPPTVRGLVREPADGELVALGIGRPALELVLYHAVRALPGVTISHRTRVRGLLLDRSASRVSDVLTDSGEQVAARYVVDATGRKAASRSWLAAAGIPAADDLTSPLHLRGFTRYYRLRSARDLPGPLNRGNAAGGIWDHYAAVVHLSGEDTFAVALAVPSADRATTALRGPGPFTAVTGLSPYVAPWTAATAATPITEVRSITMPPNILRAHALPGRRTVAGLFPVGDAVCVTDPFGGRGMSLAFQHAFRLADLLGAHPAVEESQSARAAGLADELFRPWYEETAHDSAVRGRMWRARAEGGAVPPPEPAVPGRPALAAVAAAAMTDATVWRGLTRVLMSLNLPAEIFDDPAFRDRVRAASGGDVPPGPRPPTRAELLRAIAAAEGVP